MYLKTYMDIFSHIFKIVAPRALRQLLLFIALNCLNGAAFLQTYVHKYFQYTTKLAPDVPQNVHFKIRLYIDKIHKLASNKVFYRCD